MTLATTAAAVAAEWEVDPSHSQVGFAVKHMMTATVRGYFSSFTGRVVFNPAQPKEVSAEATIEVASITTSVQRRDDHLRSPDFFDVEKFPKIIYRARRVEPLGGDRYRVIGDLTIRDVTREVTLEATGFSATYKNPWGKTVTAVSLRGTVNREDFGLMWNVALEAGGWLVSKEVTLEVELELVMKENQ